MDTARSDFLKKSGECPLSLLMRCYYASSPYAHDLYGERVPENKRLQGQWPLMPMERDHLAHLVAFIWTLKDRRSKERVSLVKNPNREKFEYDIPATDEVAVLRDLARTCGLMWVNAIQKDHALARHLLYDFDPEEGFKAESAPLPSRHKPPGGKEQGQRDIPPFLMRHA